MQSEILTHSDAENGRKSFSVWVMYDFGNENFDYISNEVALSMVDRSYSSLTENILKAVFLNKNREENNNVRLDPTTNCLQVFENETWENATYERLLHRCGSILDELRKRVLMDENIYVDPVKDLRCRFFIQVATTQKNVRFSPEAPFHGSISFSDLVNQLKKNFTELVKK